MKIALLTIIATVTMYNNHVSQTNDRPNETAFHNKKHECLVTRCGIAVSRRMEDIGFRHNCIVSITGIVETDLKPNGGPFCNGIYFVNDRMHWRWDLRVDIFGFNHSQAIEFGEQQGTIELLRCE